MDWSLIISNTFRSGITQTAIIYILAAIGMNLHVGYTGLMNFGQVGFMAVGAYGVGISTSYYDLPLPVGILVGLGCGVVLALLLGMPTLRLRADYLGIVTIAAAEIIRLVMKYQKFKDWSGGTNGINGFADDFQAWNPMTTSAKYGFEIGPLDLRFTGGDLWEMAIGWTLVLLAVLVMWRLVNSPWGRVLKSVREDENAARAMGKSIFRFKMQSLMLGGLFGTVAGMFYAISNNSVQPDNYSRAFTFFALTVAILGGLGRVWGPVIGGVLFWMLLSGVENLLKEGVTNDHIPESIMDGVQVGQVRFMLVGLGLMSLMIFRPQGIFGDKREIAIDARK
ncbi:MAG: branched-chain amino acid ABC transporter permease [Actinomycetota bacterium]|nr:branched-chain amino acid ABC transporter permease [Actinomycetota bacterium]